MGPLTMPFIYFENMTEKMWVFNNDVINTFATLLEAALQFLEIEFDTIGWSYRIKFNFKKL